MALRTVRFFQIVDQEGKRFKDQIPAQELRDAIRNVEDEFAYMQLAENFEVLGSAVEADPLADPKRSDMIILDRITREPHLKIERNRVSRPLELKEGETLAEPTFFSIFENNVLGIMRNSRTAPSYATFRDYVNILNVFDVPISVAPLIDRGRMRALKDVETIRKVTFAVGKDIVLDRLPEGSPVRLINRAIQEGIGHLSFDLSLKIDPATPSEVAESLLEEIVSLTAEDTIGQFSKLEMTYKQIQNGRVAAFDFIHEALVSQVTVELVPVTQQPTEDSAAEHLCSSYEGLYDEITATLSALRE